MISLSREEFLTGLQCNSFTMYATMRVLIQRAFDAISKLRLVFVVDHFSVALWPVKRPFKLALQNIVCLCVCVCVCACA